MHPPSFTESTLKHIRKERHLDAWCTVTISSMGGRCHFLKGHLGRTCWKGRVGPSVHLYVHRHGWMWQALCEVK